METVCQNAQEFISKHVVYLGMAVNLRELCTLYREGEAGFRSDPGIPEVRASIWCRIERDAFNGELRIITRWESLTTVDSSGNPVTITAVVGDENQSSSNFDIYFDDEDEVYDIRGIRPFDADPRRFVEIKVRSTRAGIPFT